MWFLFALLGAFFAASRDALVKKQLNRADNYVVASGVFLFAAAALFLVSVIAGFPSIGPGFFIYLSAVVILDIPSYIFTYKALKMADISRTAPMTSFELVFILFISFAMLGEVPAPVGIAGVLLIFVGSYVVNAPKGWSALKSDQQARASVYMIVAAFLAAVTANINKLLVQASDTTFGSSAVCLLLGVAFLAIALTGKRNVSAAYRVGIHKFMLTGLLMALAIAAINIAFTMQIVPYVIALKRLSIIFSVLYGAALFKEKQIKRRLAGAGIMLAGVLLILLF